MAIGFTGEAVQQIEADLHAATIENESLRRTNALQEMELAHLRAQNVKLRADCNTEMIRCAEMRTIMEQVSAGLVSGLQRMNFTRRQRQERELGVNNEDDRSPYHNRKPEFDAISNMLVEGDNQNAERLAQRNEVLEERSREVAPVVPMRTRSLDLESKLRTDIVDMRLPRVDLPGQSDDDNLRKMFDTLQTQNRR